MRNNTKYKNFKNWDQIVKQCTSLCRKNQFFNMNSKKEAKVKNLNKHEKLYWDINDL